MKYQKYLRKLIFPLEPKKNLEQRGSNIYKNVFISTLPAVAADRYVVVGQHVTRWASATTKSFGGENHPVIEALPQNILGGYAPKGLLIRLLQTNQNKQNPSKQNKKTQKPHKTKQNQTDKPDKQSKTHQKKQTDPKLQMGVFVFPRFATS